MIGSAHILPIARDGVAGRAGALEKAGALGMDRDDDTCELGAWRRSDADHGPGLRHEPAVDFGEGWRLSGRPQMEAEARIVHLQHTNVLGAKAPAGSK